MEENILVYGAYGYTGQLIIEQLQQLGLHPKISGRNKDKLVATAKEYKLTYEVCEIDDAERLEGMLKDMDVVVHCGGPFIHTAKAMVEACIKTKTHYIDITGEYQVFELVAGYDSQAKQAGIMLLPGAGFDVVPSDCLAAHLAEQLPSANELQLAFAGSGGGLSRGTAKTMVEGLGYGCVIRRDSQLTTVPEAYKVQEINFGGFKHLSATIPWGDISTAFRSTGIPNIEVFMGVTPGMLKSMKMSKMMGWLLRMDMVKNFLKKRIDNRPAGPPAKKRENAVSYFWGRVVDNLGNEKISVQTTPEGYTITAFTTAAIAKNIVEGNFKVGYQTPSMAYGKDYILQFPNCSRRDIK